MKIKSDVLLKKGKHGYEAWQTNKLLAKVPGFDEDSKDRIMKYIPTYENVIEESLDKRIVSGYQQNEKSLKAVLSGTIKSGFFDDYAPEAILISLNNYITKKVITEKDIKGWVKITDIIDRLAAFREKFIQYRDGDRDKESMIEETIELQSFFEKNLFSNMFLHACQDIINPVFEMLGEKPVKVEKPTNGMKEFTPEEIEDLYEGIVNTGDDRFYEWLRNMYPWMKQPEAIMDLETYMLQWIYDNPDIYKEMREWLDYWKDEEHQ